MTAFGENGEVWSYFYDWLDQIARNEYFQVNLKDLIHIT